MTHFDPNQMLLSGFQRYVRIVETVRNSDEHMTLGDRMRLINNLLESPGNPSVAEIEAQCKASYAANLEYNIARARHWNDANR